jgi:uncharacterized membrane protein
MWIKQRRLYLLVLGSISVVVIAALGGGLFNQQSPWQLQWQHQVFSDFCHQTADRSFWLNGQPMAVCSRCIGIYAGFAFGWFLLPVWSIGDKAGAWPIKKLAVSIILINLFDIIGNTLGFWENTLISRLILGYMIGNSAALLFAGEFFNRTMKSIENYYGRVTARNTN